MRRPIPAKLRHFLGDEDGATSIEYALLASGIAGVIVAMVTAMGTSLQGMYQSVYDGFK
ncbi:MAG TPA: Flp family type IVb pilin [Pseudolabrys sp.]|jgi:pilus assembly protein Flp/PilA|nr:Flp family type IVb pilin [Pseudolabrys sp.]